jgi:hypothetical protein
MYIYIYKYNDRNIYIGSTYNLKKRKAEHLHEATYNSSRPFYRYLRQEKIEFKELQMEIFEFPEILNHVDLRLKEREFIKIYNPNANKIYKKI